MNAQISNSGSPGKEGKRHISRVEAESLKLVLDEVFDFFYADGEGLEQEQMMIKEYQKVIRLLNLLSKTTCELMMLYYRTQIDKPQSTTSTHGHGVIHYDVKKTSNRSVDIYIQRATGLPNPDPGHYYSVAVRLRPDRDLEKDAIEAGTPKKSKGNKAIKGFIKKATNSKERDPNMNLKHVTEKKGKIGNCEFDELIKIRESDHYSFAVKELNKSIRPPEVNLDDMIIQISLWLKNKLGKDKFVGESIVGVKELDIDAGEEKMMSVSHPLGVFNISEDVGVILQILRSRKTDKDAVKFAKRRLLEDSGNISDDEY